MGPGFDAAVLDVDGVLTNTASQHQRAWKRLLDEELPRHGDRHPFSSADYRLYVDGKPRRDGLRAVLAARGIALPEDEVQALAARKDAWFLELLREEGVQVFEDAARMVRRWRCHGLGIAFISASRNAGRVLEAAGLAALGDVRVDGLLAAELGLASKADLMREALRRLEVAPERALLVEDAIVGIEAARAVGFGLVIGVARTGEDLLSAHGAHRVVERLDELWDLVEPGTRRSTDLPSALRFELLEERLHRQEPAVLLAPELGDAPPGSALARAMHALAACCEVAVLAQDEDRAQAAARQLARWSGRPARPLPIYVGGAPADEPVFAQLRHRGIAVRVGGGPPRPTHADLRLADHDELARFLGDLCEWLDRREQCMDLCLRFEGYRPGEERLREALCTLANGVFSTRGAAEEVRAGEHSYPGTYLAGGYDRIATEINGLVVVNEDLVNWPNWLPLTFRPDGGAWLSPATYEVLELRQDLDVLAGVLRRDVRVKDPQGRITRLTSERFVSMDDPHVAGVRWRLRPENWSGLLQIRSSLDGTVTNAGVARYRPLRGQHLVPGGVGHGEDTIWLATTARQSHVRLAQVARTRVRAGDGVVLRGREVKEHDDRVDDVRTLEAAEGAVVELEKRVVMHSSLDHAISEPLTEAQDHLARIEHLGFGELIAAHERRWGQLWHRCYIRLDGGAEANRILRLHLFHLLQVCSPHIVDRDVGVPARGLHGEAYRGHVFWDELFIFPLLNYAIPELTRELLMYRYRRLDVARARARALGLSGAAYPWQSGSNGREESQTWHLNPLSGRWLPDETHLQRHIGAAIAWNVWQYVQATGDHEFLAYYGAEMLLEIARFWASLASWDEHLGRFRLRGVVGPDEFHTRYPGADRPGIDDNAYTNVMAAWSLRCAERALEELPADRRHELLAQLGISDADRARWQEIASRLRVVFHGDGRGGRGESGHLISQFDGYEHLAELDWDAYLARYGDLQRLDRVLEAEGDSVNRYQVSKQADVLMLFYLFSADELTELLRFMGYTFEPDLIPENVDYYLRRTSHGSTLSRVVHSWVLARCDRAASFALFEEALRSDVADLQGGTSAEGIHLGAMAGTVDLVKRGYTGAVIRDGVLWLEPSLPDEVRELRTRFRVRGAWVDVRVTHEELEAEVSSGPAPSVRVGYGGRVLELKQGERRIWTLAGEWRQQLRA